MLQMFLYIYASLQILFIDIRITDVLQGLVIFQLSGVINLKDFYHVTLMYIFFLIEM